MQRLCGWVLPAYALVITFFAFFPGWPVRQQSAAESQRLAPDAGVTSKPVPPPPDKLAANHVNYPIPAPAKPPKHLFHLVIRYEGDGLIDQNAVEVCKSCLMQAAQDEEKKAPEKPAPAKPAGSNLFQFIVRYEGEGIIDNNVVDLVKAYLSAENSQEEEGKKSEDRSSPATPSPKSDCAPKP